MTSCERLCHIKGKYLACLAIIPILALFPLSPERAQANFESEITAFVFDIAGMGCRVGSSTVGEALSKCEIAWPSTSMVTFILSLGVR